MSSGQPRRSILRALGFAAAGASVVGTAAACRSDENMHAASGVQWAQPQATPIATFPPGPTSTGTNIPVLAEGNALGGGARRHDLDIVWQVDTRQNLVALTFDDGPDPAVSPMLYQILEDTRTKATFFMVGERVLNNPKVIHGRMDRHEVGNHTFSHESLFLKNTDEALEDLKQAHRAITAIIGREPTLLRPPWAHINGNTLVAAAHLGYDIVMWNGFIGDEAYVNREEQLIEDVVHAVIPGSVLLGHDAGESRMIAIRNLPKIIEELKRRKFEFVTISELRSAA